MVIGETGELLLMFLMVLASLSFVVLIQHWTQR